MRYLAFLSFTVWMRFLISRPVVFLSSRAGFIRLAASCIVCAEPSNVASRPSQTTSTGIAWGVLGGREKGYCDLDRGYGRGRPNTRVAVYSKLRVLLLFYRGCCHNSHEGSCNISARGLYLYHRILSIGVLYVNINIRVPIFSIQGRQGLRCGQLPVYVRTVRCGVVLHILLVPSNVRSTGGLYLMVH